MYEMLKKPTVWAVIVFVIIFTWALAAGAATPHTFTVGLGKGVLNGNEWTQQQIGYEYNRKWYAQAARLGGDSVLPTTYRYTMGRLVNARLDKRVSPYARLGIAYFADSPSALVDDHWTFDLGIVVTAWHVIRLEWRHNSTAGRSSPNTGIDLVELSFRLAI